MRPEPVAAGLRRFAQHAVVALTLSVGSAQAVELNTASRAELERLDGFGVSTAARVLEARERQPFADWGDFTRRVKGIKAQRLEQLRRQGATINGAPPPVALPPSPASQ